MAQSAKEICQEWEELKTYFRGMAFVIFRLNVRKIIKMKSVLLLFLFVFLSLSGAQAQSPKDTLEGLGLSDVKKGTILVLNKQIRVPAMYTKTNLFFTDEHVCVGEILIQKQAEDLILEKGMELEIFRIEPVKLKDYFGYATKTYIFFTDQKVNNILITCPNKVLNLSDLDDTDITDHLFSIKK